MKKIHVIFSAIVLAALLIPSVLMLCGFKNANRENRVLAKMPELVSEKGVNTKFASGFDKYVDDHFALREYLVTGFNTAQKALLRDFNGSNAVIGSNNFIYYGETVNDYLGVDQLTRAQINSIAAYLYDVQQGFAERGIRFAFMTAARRRRARCTGNSNRRLRLRFEKASLRFPRAWRPTDAPRNIDMLEKAMTEKGVEHVNALEILLEGKKTRSVYYEHDSHWNNYGAMLVYNAIAEKFGLEKYEASVYTAEKDRTGDLHNFVYPSSDHLEERIIYPKFHEYSSKRPINFDRDKLVETVSEVNGLTAAFYHDSFGRSLQPILSQSLGKLSMNSYFPYNWDFVEETDADLVIVELVERNLDLLYETAISLGY